MLHVASFRRGHGCIGPAKGHLMIFVPRRNAKSIRRNRYNGLYPCPAFRYHSNMATIHVLVFPRLIVGVEVV